MNPVILFGVPRRIWRPFCQGRHARKLRYFSEATLLRNELNLHSIVEVWRRDIWAYFSVGINGETSDDPEIKKDTRNDQK